MSKRKSEPEPEAEITAGLIPTHNIGKNIIAEAQERVRADMQNLVLTKVANMMTRADSLQVKRQTLDKQIIHIKRQINAIQNNQFTIVRGNIIFNDLKLNEDCAVAHPYSDMDYTIHNPRS